MASETGRIERQVEITLSESAALRYLRTDLEPFGKLFFWAHGDEGPIWALAPYSAESDGPIEDALEKLESDGWVISWEWEFNP